MLPTDMDMDKISNLFGFQLRNLPLEEQTRRGGKYELRKAS